MVPFHFLFNLFSSMDEILETLAQWWPLSLPFENHIGLYYSSLLISLYFFECADSVSFDVWKPWLKKRYSPLLRGSVQVHDPNTQRNSNMVFVHSVIPHCWAGLPYTPYRLLPRTIPGSMFTVREKFLRDEVGCMYIFCTTTSSRNKSQQQIILYRVSSSSLK